MDEKTHQKYAPLAFPNDSFMTGGSPIDPQKQMSDSWLSIQKELKELVGDDSYDSWVRPIQHTYKDANNLVLFMPNLVFYRTFLGRFQNLIENLQDQLQLTYLNITYEILNTQTTEDSTSSTFPKTVAEPSPTRESEEFTQNNGASSLLKTISDRCNLNPNYTFEAFVKGPSNQFAHATCQAVADNPGKTYNPLFIYGSSGLGKTHLLHAVGWQVLKTNPNAVICYISCEQFMNEMIYCLRFNKMWDFRKKYRNCDVFLVDDIQFIQQKDRTQEEFFHTFNALYENKKQIVITSDKFPQDISDIEDRLKNRFQWGLIADIQPPDIEHRVAILLTKADQLGVDLPEEVAMYLANHFKRNIRELEGALHRMAAFATFNGRPISLDLAKETFQSMVIDNPRSLTVDTIQKIVADHFKIKISDLKSKKRHRAISLPRQIAMYLSRKKTKSSFPEIGAKFGGKDHTTVMHAVTKIKKDLDSDLDLRTHMESLDRKIEQSS
jgi:chromosomal replication initiator protein